MGNNIVSSLVAVILYCQRFVVRLVSWHIFQERITKIAHIFFARASGASEKEQHTF